MKKRKEVLTVGGVLGEQVIDVIKRMISLSKERNKEVYTTFNGVTFSVTAFSTEEEAYALWDKIREDDYKKWQNSPEGIKAAAEQKALQEEKIKAVDVSIKDEVLELTAPKYWKRSAERPYGAQILRYAERWGKLMQVEMKLCKTKILTEEIQKATQLKAVNEEMLDFSWSSARGVLIQCWKYGDQLGKLGGFTDKIIRKARKKAEV